MEPYFANTYLRSYNVPIMTDPNQNYGCFPSVPAAGRRPAAQPKPTGR